MPTAVVVGAGVFGASLARELAGRGWDVTLVERFPAGHVRAASGGESRLIRYGHGDERWYVRSAWRARDLWRDIQAEAGHELLVESGLIWFAHGDEGWETDTERVLREEGIPVERLDLDETARLYPSFDPEELVFGLLEPEAGVLRARLATRALVAQAVARGARLVAGTARPAGGDVDVDGTRYEADQVVWACGAWLAKLFPGVVPLRITRQDNFYLAVPAAWQTPPVPAWVDYDLAFYGLGDLDGHGAKIASDHEGPEFDPETDPRIAALEDAAAGRELVARRFPELGDAPLAGAHVCQYALTVDTNFVVAPHPERASVWLLGGGSGHGFKHGPALAEYVAELLDGRADPDEQFSLGPRGARRNLRTGVAHI